MRNKPPLCTRQRGSTWDRIASRRHPGPRKQPIAQAVGKRHPGQPMSLIDCLFGWGPKQLASLCARRKVGGGPTCSSKTLPTSIVLLTPMSLLLRHSPRETPFLHFPYIRGVNNPERAPPRKASFFIHGTCSRDREPANLHKAFASLQARA